MFWYFYCSEGLWCLSLFPQSPASFPAFIGQMGPALPVLPTPACFPVHQVCFCIVSHHVFANYLLCSFLTLPAAATIWGFSMISWRSVSCMSFHVCSAPGNQPPWPVASAASPNFPEPLLVFLSFPRGTLAECPELQPALKPSLSFQQLLLCYWPSIALHSSSSNQVQLPSSAGFSTPTACAGFFLSVLSNKDLFSLGLLTVA